MPIYCFECQECGHKFEEVATMSQATNLSPNCPECNAKSDRDFQSESTNCFGPIKTLGALADKNTSKMSQDEIKHREAQNRSPSWRKKHGFA